MDWEQFFLDLDTLGYFRYLTDTKKKQIPRMQAKLKETAYFFSLKANRDYPADPKRLARGGVKSFLIEIKPILKANGIVIDTIEENCSHDGYSIKINETDYTLYSAEELHRPNKEFWDLTTTRTFSIINKLLKDTGSNERIFSTFGGTEEWAIFLTIDLYELLVQNGIIQVGTELFLYEDMQ